MIVGSGPDPDPRNNIERGSKCVVSRNTSWKFSDTSWFEGVRERV